MSAIAEEEAIAEAGGDASLLYPRLHLVGLHGRRQEALALLETATTEATTHGGGLMIANAHWAAAVRNNGLADYPAALAAASSGGRSRGCWPTGEPDEIRRARRRPTSRPACGN